MNSTPTPTTVTAALPQLSGHPVVTDGGLESDLIFHHGVELPDFAAFVLLDDARGRELLDDYFADYVDIARRAGAALQLETPTWRASADWGLRLGYSAADLRRVNGDAVRLLARIRDGADLETFLISGNLGPQGDGYVPGDETDPDAFAAYHRPQAESLADAGADVITALTITTAAEAVGIVRAVRPTGLPVAVSFTVETNGRLPDGSTLADAVSVVDADGGPDYFMVNCAHPTHIARATAAPGDWRDRIVGIRANASSLSHAELDEATELDEGDPVELATAQDTLRGDLRNLSLVGGCCGTDARHVAAMWGVS